MDVKPNDDIIDILGFLAFEVVRELCVGAVTLKQSLEEESAHIKRLTDGSKVRKNIIESNEGSATNNDSEAVEEDEGGRDEKTYESAANGESLGDGAKGSSSSSSSLLLEEKPAGGATMKRKNTQSSVVGEGATAATTSKRTKREASPTDTACGLFTMPPAKASPLMTSHVREAFARLQRDRSALSTGGGGIAGGLKRTRVFVI